MKNYLIKRRNIFDTIFELAFPLILSIFVLLINLLMTSNSSEVSLYRFNFVLNSVIPMLSANTCRYLLFQIPKEKEINVHNTLLIMNMESGAYGLSFFLIQLPQCLWTSFLLSLACIPAIDSSLDRFLFFIVTFIFGMTMLQFSLTTTTLFKDSKFATQIGFIALFAPVIIYHACTLYLGQANQLYLIYYFFLIPHFPSMALLQSYLKAYLIESDAASIVP